jgi:hypothetical protein
LQPHHPKFDRLLVLPLQDVGQKTRDPVIVQTGLELVFDPVRVRHWISPSELEERSGAMNDAYPILDVLVVPQWIIFA